MCFQERGLGGQVVLRDGCVFSGEGFRLAGGFEGGLCVFSRGVWVGSILLNIVLDKHDSGDLFPVCFAGREAWEKYPMLKCLIEMVMTKSVAFCFLISSF